MDIGDVLAIEHDFAAADGFETANGTKERTLSASRGSDKDDEFLFFNLKIDVLKGVKGFVIFLDLSQFQISHRVKPLKVRFFWGANNAGWVTAARKRFDISHIPRAEARFFYSFGTQIQRAQFFTNAGVTRMAPVGTRSCAIRRAGAACPEASIAGIAPQAKAAAFASVALDAGKGWSLHLHCDSRFEDKRIYE